MKNNETDTIFYNLIKETCYLSDNKQKYIIYEYEKNGEIQKRNKRSPNDKIDFVIEYNPKTNKPIKKTYYNDDSIFLTIKYDSDGKVSKIKKRKNNQTTKKQLIKETRYRFDENRVYSIFEYIKGNQIIQESKYPPNDDIFSVIEYNPKTEKSIKQTYYNKNSITSITEYEYNKNNQLIKETDYNKDGTITSITNYDNNENITKETEYNDDGTIFSVIDYK
ncbi:DUF2963 domain-containing protein [Candidatus Phytoplasma meliae]|uniref:DUF2963 domain-containing protein n=1 Tax=Candidatus Phytoplasma meliae TaxID=1848402 RepID=A0ABS5CXZ2_9MOLU|nr:DUF2963 domain-containing protein [Candidatus Phytoplasma meliae]MBP5835841.1 DUF2963 domain-containing protein [Candidatus Phytoplasma meliae]